MKSREITHSIEESAQRRHINNKLKYYKLHTLSQAEADPRNCQWSLRDQAGDAVLDKWKNKYKGT